MSTFGSDLEEAAARLAGALENDGVLAAESRQRLLAALVRSYAQDRDGSPIQPGSIDPVQVMVAVADLLTAVEVTSFELAAMCNV
jgi:hypothetical protein